MAEPLRIMSLHALAYCERLFYLEEVEEIRVADERVYAGRRLHVDIDKQEARRAGGDFVRKRKQGEPQPNTKPPWEKPEPPSSTQDLANEGEEERVTFSLESEKWGLKGKVDCLRR